MISSNSKAASDERPDLSVVIPTKNRHKTAIEAIQSCLQKPGNLEVIVQDCSDGPELEDALRDQVHDPRVKYAHTSEPLSMTENWNRAIDRTTGECVIVIGDDDAITDDLLEVVHWARANGIESLASSPFRYFWPDFPGRYAGELLIYRTTKSLKKIDVAFERERASHASGERIKRLPEIYHGLVRRSALERLRKQTGQIFDSINPDYYARFALASCIETHFRLDYPLTTVGCSGPSNSGRNKSGTIDRHLEDYRRMNWPSVLPPVSSLAPEITLTATMLRALEQTDRPELIRNVNLAALFASYIHKHPAKINSLLHHFVSSVRTLGRSLPREVILLAVQVLRQYASLVPFRLVASDVPTRDLVSVEPFVGILDANREREAHLARDGVLLSRVLAEAEKTLDNKIAEV